MIKGKTIKKLFLAYALVFLWALVIFKLSSEGSDASSGRSDVIVSYIHQLSSSLPRDILTFLTRKAAHIIAYFILGILVYNVLRHYRRPTRSTIIAGISFVLLYAISDEFHQTFVPGRSGELRDVLIDTTAGAVGVALAFYLHRLIVKRRVALQPSDKLKTKA